MKDMKYMENNCFKEAMAELAKNSNMSVAMAEQKIGLEKDFVEMISRGIKELTLSDVIKIAQYFDTTMDAVLDGGKHEIRVCNRHADDKLLAQYFKECVDEYTCLLDYKASNYWKPNLWEENEREHKVELEKKEHYLLERYKTHMDEYERNKIHPMDAREMDDSVLIAELEKRGFYIERKMEHGQKTN